MGGGDLEGIALGKISGHPRIKLGIIQDSGQVFALHRHLGMRGRRADPTGILRLCRARKKCEEAADDKRQRDEGYHELFHFIAGALV